jgi:EAL domain-containing protein (putative c-di-GMP-specific phosphodiesterase class I)
MYAVYAAMGGLLAAELAAEPWPIVRACIRLAWRCCAAVVAHGVAAEFETRRRRWAAGLGGPEG